MRSRFFVHITSAGEDSYYIERKPDGTYLVYVGTDVYQEDGWSPSNADEFVAEGWWLELRSRPILPPKENS